MTPNEYFISAFIITLVLLVGYPLYLMAHSMVLSKRERMARQEERSSSTDASAGSPKPN